jgi:hypothetical protein
MQAFAAFMKDNARGHAIANPHGPPSGVAVFAGDHSIRALLDPERAFASWSEFDRGGHFPAMEVPDPLVGELRRFFGSVS